MDFLVTFFVAVGLAMDCFAVSLGVGTSPIELTKRLIFRISWHFGLFQGGMTFLGWLAGSTIAPLIEKYDHWVAFALLAWVGVRMMIEGIKGGDSEIHLEDPSRGKTLIILSVATSIDALAVGLSMAMVDGGVLIPSLLIGVMSTVLSLVGLFIGNRLTSRFGRRMEILGGLILNFIGLRIMFTHMMI